MRWAVGASLLIFVAGCGGVHATKSVSPLDFLVPGGGGLLRHLLYNPPPAPPGLTNSNVAALPAAPATTQVASVR